MVALLHIIYFLPDLRIFIRSSDFNAASTFAAFPVRQFFGFLLSGSGRFSSVIRLKKDMAIGADGHFSLLD